MKEIIKKNLYEKFDEDFDEILYFLECIDSINCDIFTDGYGSYFYDGDFIGNENANGLREIIDNMFEYIKDEHLELIAKELNINDDKVRKENINETKENDSKRMGSKRA